MPKRKPGGGIYNPSPVTPEEIGVVQPPEILDGEDALYLTLVNIYRQVLADVSVHDAVMLQLSTTPIQVQTIVGSRIGDVASSDEAVVRSKAKTTGRVAKLEKGIPTCVIRVA